MMHDVFGSGVRVVIYDCTTNLVLTYTHTDHISLPITMDYRDFDFMALFRNTYGNVRQKNDRLVWGVFCRFCFLVVLSQLLYDEPGALRLACALTDGLPDGVR